jgi:hypothetical protein
MSAVAVAALMLAAAVLYWRHLKLHELENLHNVDVRGLP